MSWQDKLTQVNDMTDQSSGGLYDRMTILRQVENDKSFIAFCETRKIDYDEFLSKRLKDTQWQYAMLVRLHKAYDREQWVETGPRALAISLQRAARHRQKEVKLEDAVQAARKKARATTQNQPGFWKARFELYKARLSVTRSKLRDLKRENASLREELELLRASQSVKITKRRAVKPSA